MDRNPFRGDFSKTPLPKILAGLWREERSGHLRINEGTAEKIICFERGHLAVDRSTFDEPGFLRLIASLGLAGQVDLERVAGFARQEGKGLAYALIRSGLFSSSRLWNLIGSFSKTRIWTMFNEPQGSCIFDPGQVPVSALWIRDIRLPPLILEGVRTMWNFDVIETHLPPPEEHLQDLPHHGIGLDELEPHEKYILSASVSAESLAELYTTSDLGEKETKRVLFALLSLGILGTSQSKNHNSKALSELHLADMDRMFAAFNDRCSHIFKYISKEIGPVALNVLEKSLDEIKERIDPAFRHSQIKPDGRIELGPMAKKNLGASSEEGKKSLLLSFDEILAAEVLAVKRTLGNNHESALVKGLERMGDVR